MINYKEFYPDLDDFAFDSTKEAIDFLKKLIVDLNSSGKFGKTRFLCMPMQSNLMQTLDLDADEIEREISGIRKVNPAIKITREVIICSDDYFFRIFSMRSNGTYPITIEINPMLTSDKDYEVKNFTEFQTTLKMIFKLEKLSIIIKQMMN